MRRRQYRALGVCLLFLALWLGGCARMEDHEAAQPVDREIIGKIEPGRSIGQTFTLRRAPLANIQLWLRMSEGAADFTSMALVELLDEPGSNAPLASARLSYETINAQTPVRVTFPSGELTAGRQYYLRLRAEGTPLWVYGRGADAYAGNQAYLDEQPINAHLAFRYAYHYGWPHFWADLTGMIVRFGPLFWGLIVLFLPGWAYLAWTGLKTRYDAPMNLALALGLSLSLLAIVMVWTSTLGLSWNAAGARVFGLSLLVAVVITWLIQFRKRTMASRVAGLSQPAKFWTDPKRSAVAWSLVCLGALFCGALLVRLAMIRDLSAPPWVDPVHHGIITRIILESGQTPASYTPYSPVATAHYHSGYHSNLAFYLWLSDLEMSEGMLIHGQLLNAASILAVYLLAIALVGNNHQGVITGLVAALVTGFVTPMPAYYTSWGRYTQLAGILILPAAFWLTKQGFRHLLDAQKEPLPLILRDNLPTIIGAVISLAGLFLVHYRVAAFAACLVVADLLANVPLPRDALFRRYCVAAGWWLLSVALLAALFALPWAIPAFQTLLIPRWQEWSTAPASAFNDFSWRHLTAGAGSYALYAAAGGLILATFRQPRLAITLVLWIAGMFTLANLGALGLPGSGFVTNVSVLIALFMPVSVATGYLVWRLWSLATRRIPTHFRILLQAMLITSLAIAAVVGSRLLINLLNPNTIFFHQADRAAIAWLDEHLPQDARFLINPASWGYGLFVGSDGGYWISPLSGRVTFPPSLLYSYGEGQQTIEVNQAIKRIFDHADNPTAIWHDMQALGLDYLYLGAHGGPLVPATFVQSSRFEILYRHKQVWIFQRVRQ